MKVVVSREIPRFKGYWANDNNTITKPNGRTTKGYLESTGYNRIQINYKKYKVSVLVASAFVENPRPDIFHIVDHKDRNRANNRPSNLRYLNHSLNRLNSSATNCTLENGRWRARVGFDGKKIHVGMFDSFEEGFRVARKYREELFEKEYNRLVNSTDLK